LKGLLPLPAALLLLSCARAPEPPLDGPSVPPESPRPADAPATALLFRGLRLYADGDPAGAAQAFDAAARLEPRSRLIARSLRRARIESRGLPGPDTR
jgi:hypothetical protein